MSNFDPTYVRALNRLQAEQVQDGILGRHRRALARRLRPSRRRDDFSIKL